MLNFLRHHRRIVLLLFAGAVAALNAFVWLPGEKPPPLVWSDAPIPTFDATNAPPVAYFARPVEQLCAELDANWGSDWPIVIAVLQTLATQGAACGGSDPHLQLYPAYYNYGAWLEAKGFLADALFYYRKALEIVPDGREAALALRAHDALTPPPPARCTNDAYRAALDSLPPYAPVGQGGFVALAEGRFVVEGVPFRVRGVNYYPSRAPWRRFLTEGDPAVMALELDLIRGAGLNTIRVFAWHEALFQCPGSGAVPRLEGFARLDAVIGLAAARGLRLIVTLNDLPDLLVRPLYSDPVAANAQTLFIVNRYRDEPAILAWDLRNEGDIDYVRGYTQARTVLSWLRDLSAQVRMIDPNHLITAGWNEGPYLTDSAVDFLSFHHWRSAENLAGRLADYRARSDKPMLLEEVGYATPANTVERQVSQLQAALSLAEAEGLLGWLVWTAFDFPTDVTCIPPACPSQDNAEHHFGLWRTDYTPKPAVAMIVAQFTGKR